MATIKQIAEMAGVSRGTVDRVLNNRGSVNANTAARVREIAEKLNYKPNKAGLMLAAQKKNLKIGVILFPDSNPFFSEVLEGVNAKAKELGCTNTHFANPHGLQDENHYTTAHDMALIAQAAYQNETFRIIIGTKMYTIPPTNKHAEETVLRNHHDII